MRTTNLVAFGLISFFTGVAVAAPAFPERTRNHLSMECLPQCTICHESSTASRGNATRPFGETVTAALGDLGYDITDTDSIEKALDKIEKDGTDSDGDGTPDITELTASPPKDPSTSGAGNLCVDPEVAYGCGAHLAQQSKFDPWPVLLGLGVAAAFAFRLRRRAGAKS